MDKERDLKIREILSDNNVGAVLLWRPDEMVLSTGHLPLWGVSACLYPSMGNPIIYVPELEPEDILPKDFTIKRFPWGRLDCTNPWGVLYQSIKEDLELLHADTISFIPHSCRSILPQISAETAPIPLDFTDNLKQLSKRGYKDITNDILKLYSVKTPIECEKIRKSNQIAYSGIKAFYENLQVGKSEVEIACAVEAAVQLQIGKSDIKYAKAWPYIMSGTNSSFAGMYCRNTDRTLKEGELVLIEMAVCVDGYWCDITRTGSVGNIAPKQQEIFETVKSAHNLSIDSIRPGKKAGDIDKIAREYIDRKGFGQYFQHALGHHVGFRYHDPGLGFQPDSNLILEEGMILSVEPGIYIQDLNSGVRIEDNVLVTNDGAEILSDYSMELTGL